MTTPVKLKSFGIIPLYRKGDVILTAIVKHQDGHWGLPKGTPREGEDPISTALRELREETGVSKIEIIQDIRFAEKYSFEHSGTKYNKEVIYFLGWTHQIPDKFDPLEDVAEVKWLPLPEAKQSLTYPEARKIIGEVEDYLNISK